MLRKTEDTTTFLYTILAITIAVGSEAKEETRLGLTLHPQIRTFSPINRHCSRLVCYSSAS